MVTRADIDAAARRIAPFVAETPVMRSRRLSAMAGCELYFKCEHLQTTGAFKYRGATNAVQLLTDAEATKGVATHSSGNHGAALARAAAERSIPAHIVIPRNANAAKRSAIVGYGADVVECDITLFARESALAEVVRKTGANFVPPYDDDRIIAGQGTLALELTRSVPDLEVIVAPVGGGGMLSGIAVATAGSGRSLYGAEPREADDAYRSLQTGERITEVATTTVADGLRTTLGIRNFAIIRRQVDGILLISEAEIINAMRLLWTTLKQLVEPSAATAFAAILAHPDTFKDKRVGVVLSGGNVDLGALPFRG